MLASKIREKQKNESEWIQRYTLCSIADALRMIADDGDNEGVPEGVPVMAADPYPVRRDDLRRLADELDADGY